MNLKHLFYDYPSPSEVAKNWNIKQSALLPVSYLLEIFQHELVTQM